MQWGHQAVPSQRRTSSKRFVIPGFMAVIAILVASGALSACGSEGTSASATGSKQQPVQVSNTQLSGAGAFMGPVKRVKVGDIKIGYRQFGQGPPLVMVMGDTAAMSDWGTKLPKRLSQDFRVTMFDNRGVSYSTDNTSEPMTIELMAKDTAGLESALGIHKPIVLGWSMGGEIGIAMTVLYPNSVGTLISSGGDAGSSQMVVPVDYNQVNAELADPNFSPFAKLAFIFPPGASQAEQAFISDYLSVPTETVSTRTLQRQKVAEDAYVTDSTIFARLGQIHAKVLITNGSDDRLVPVQNATILGRHIPYSRVVIFQGAGHAMMYQDMDQFVNLVVHFAR